MTIGVSNTSSVIEEIQLTGEYKGRRAAVYHIVGRRSGFTSTTTPNDLKEFDSTSAFFTQLNGTEPLEIVSSSVNDTIAGTGLRSVKITYLSTTNNIVQSKAVNLDGLTPVPLYFTANEIYWMESASSGSSRLAQGNITIRIVAGSTEIEQITQNSSKSKTGKFIIPAGFTGYLYKWSTEAINNDQDVFILAQCETTTRAASPAYHFQGNTYTPINVSSPEKELGFLKIPELARVKLSTISAGTASTVRASGSFIIAIISKK